MCLRIFFPLFVLCSFLISCEKDEQKVEERPILSLLKQPSISIDTSIAAVEWIYGFKFTLIKDGKISGLGMKLPKQGSYKAKLWNLDSGTLLTEEIITSNVAHDEVFNAISDIVVQKNTNLGVTIEADSFYKIRRSNNSDFTFPIEAGNIRILSFHESRVSENINGNFPSMSVSNEMSPCVDVIFIAE
jgi:hypothetical protein